MSLEARIIALAQTIGADIKTLNTSQGALSGLSTITKTSLVSAINELVAAMGSAGAQIDDLAGNGATGVTWSADKIFDAIEEAKSAVAASILASAPAALDTLNELAAALGNDPNFATTLATSVANRVRYDAAQTLTSGQKTQARDNIGAADAAALATLTTNIGNTDADFSAAYTTAKT